MARKKSKYSPRTWETSGGKLSATIYASMIQSVAWERLTNNARVLYVYMKLQFFGQKPIPDRPETDFYFNGALLKKTYHLYSNMAQFRKDRQQLIDNGFIEIVENGKNMRTRSIYRFSGAWQDVR